MFKCIRSIHPGQMTSIFCHAKSSFDFRRCQLPNSFLYSKVHMLSLDWKIIENKLCYSRNSYQHFIGCWLPDLNELRQGIFYRTKHSYPNLCTWFVSVSTVYSFSNVLYSFAQVGIRAAYMYACIYFHTVSQNGEENCFARAVEDVGLVVYRLLLTSSNCLYWVRPLPAAFCQFSCATAHFPQLRILPTHAHCDTQREREQQQHESVCKQ